MTQAVGVILAGGRATRMGGGDKGLLDLGGVRLLDHVVGRLAPQVSALAINANGDPARFSDFGVPVVPDSVADFPGPLAGVLAGLDWAAAEGADLVVTAAADTPFLPRDLVERLGEAGPLALAATPDPKRGVVRHPTFGIWPVALREDLRAALAEGLRKVVLWTERHGARDVVFEGDDPFFNINTPEDLVRAEALLSRAPKLRNDCFALPPGVDWTPVETALDGLRALSPVVGAERIATGRGMGRRLAADAIARRSNPPGPNAAVDGYGFAHAHVAPGQIPLTAGRAAAGDPHPHPVPAGHAVRILTGALLPEGVDTVVLEEDTAVTDRHITLDALPKPGANTRKAGEDVVAGDQALAAGRQLGAADLALLSALGLAEISVSQQLRVGVLSTGDELVPPGATDDPARTYDANRPMLLALAERWGHRPVDLGHVPDDRDALRARLDTADAHVILTSGGASAGDEDHVSALLREEGKLETWRIAVKPGRPLALALWKGVPVFGLPGNPVAAFVCALVFARPALSRLAGGDWLEPVGYSVPAAFSKRKKPGRREYLRARINAEGAAEVFPSEGSGRISGLSWADGLVELEDGGRRIDPGDRVRYLPYGSFGL